MHTAYNTDLAAHTTHNTKPVPNPHQSARRHASTTQNSAAPLDTPHSALAAGVDTPQPAALGNCQLRVYRAYQWPRS